MTPADAARIAVSAAASFADEELGANVDDDGKRIAKAVAEKLATFGKERGWLTDPKVIERAKRYVSRCALPNGAFAYDLHVLPRRFGIRPIPRPIPVLVLRLG